MADSKPNFHFNSTRFGDLEVPEGKIIDIPEGIIGFPDFKRYAILDPSEGESIFLWLHAVEEPNLAFIITEASSIAPDFTVDASESDLERLDIDVKDEHGLFVIVSVPPDDPEKISANLLAPILYRKSDNTMFQIVLQKGDWPLKYYFFEKGEVELSPGDNNDPDGEVQ